MSVDKLPNPLAFLDVVAPPLALALLSPAHKHPAGEVGLGHGIFELRGVILDMGEGRVAGLDVAAVA